MIDERAYDLAKQGLTNIELFGVLGISSSQLMSLALSDKPLLFAIIKGRVDYLRPFIKTLEDEATALVGQGNPTRNSKALFTLIERMDKENRALGIGYDLSLLAMAPVVSKETIGAAELTKLLRETA